MKIYTSILFLIVFAFISEYAQAQDWVEFENVSNTNIVADSGLGLNDTFEKDLEAADLDRDGDVDLIIARKVRFSTAGGKANILLMNENGVMTDRTSTYAADFLDDTDDRDVIAVDVNNDGWLDVVTATTFSETPRVYMNLGEMNGQWLGLDYVAADGRILPFPIGPKFCAVAAGDVTGDGFVDLFFADYANNLEDRLLVNDGQGFFVDETDTRMTAAMSESVFGTSAEIVDMNGDTFKDIVKVSSSGNMPPPGSTPPQVRIMYNDGTGNFSEESRFNDLKPYMMEVFDINNDDRMDVFVVSDDQDFVMRNTGNDNDDLAVFDISEITNSPNTDFFGGNTFRADLDGDGFEDMMVADVDTDIAGCDRFLVGLRNINGNSLVDPFRGQGRPWLTEGTFDIAIADFNNDGFLDMWSGICDGNRLFFQIPRDLIFRNGFETTTP
ncbi:FG-GAP repeat domain-containing protein [Marinicella sp. W31]|uniref:FG-GAP repeat domain-containing protein n=1 Tax=Marinicella sp. W31 TaxID=3023713 RepID=UPI0037567E1B